MANITDNTVVLVINGPGNHQPNGIAADTITTVVALAAVGSRFVSRRIAHTYFGWDDWLVLLAMVVGIANYGLDIWWFHIGGGKYIGDVTPARLRVTLAIVFIAELFWCTALLLTRASALVLWRRIFPQNWVKYFCWTWRVLNVFWWISAVLSTCLQCRPLRYLFDILEAPPGACSEVKRPYLANGVVSIILDVVVIGLPMALIWQLKLSRAMRLSICAMFLTGFLTVVMTIIRVCILLNSDLGGEAALNVTWVYSNVGFWTSVELNIAIISVCLPCIRPLLVRAAPRAWKPKSLLYKWKWSSRRTLATSESVPLDHRSTSSTTHRSSDSKLQQSTSGQDKGSSEIHIAITSM